MPDTLLIPGLNGSPDSHWQRHWARDCEGAVVVEQDDWSCPVLKDWQDRLDEALAEKEGAFLVAHSLGCLLVASYARRKEASKIRGALLVAPCSLRTTMDRHPCMIDFGVEPMDPLPFPAHVVGSFNDPYMDIAQLMDHVQHWGCELTMVGFAGHINVASGFGRWQEGYRLAERLELEWNRKGPSTGAERPHSLRRLAN
jgi:uncharacterized protein